MSVSKKNNCLLASTSTLHQDIYLGYLLPELEVLFEDVDEIVFIPYARPGGISHDAYTKKAKKAFAKIGKNCKGIHEFHNPIEAITQAKGIFTGGGNTFVLLSQLYEFQLIEILKHQLEKGIPYLGTSAGSNICGLSIKTTNDMPIAYPPSFDALGVVPFLINPHYIDADPNSKHMGETRETRIKEFLAYHQSAVVGLREGSWLRVNESSIILKGTHTAKLFYKNATEEIAPGFDFGLLNPDYAFESLQMHNE